MSFPSTVRARGWDVVALVVLLGLAAAIAWPFMASDGWPVGHEDMRYVVIADGFADALRQGEPYPRYLSDLYGGYGYPVFCFYQPALFYLSSMFSAAVGDPVMGLRLTVLVLLALGGVGAWCLGRLQAGRAFGLFAGLTFLLTPYLCVELYVRGDLSELMGMMIVPWVIFATLQLARRVASGGDATWSVVSLTFWLGLLVTSHPAPALFVAPFSAALAICVGLGRPWARAYWLRFATAAAIAAALTSPYWATLMELRPFVGFERLTSSYYRPEQHLLAPHQLISNGWGFGGSLTASTDDTMPFQLGAMHLALAVVGAWFGRRSRAILIATAVYLLLILSMLEISRPVWEGAGVLRFLQFPWRILSVTATLQIMAAAGILGVYRRWLATKRAGPRRVAVGVALVGWVLATAVIGREQFAVGRTANPGPVLERFRGDGFAPQFRMLGGVSEYVPKTARERPPSPRDRSQPPFRVAGPGTITEYSDNDYDLQCTVSAERELAVVIERVYLPEWRVEVNGVALSRDEIERGLTTHGFMRLPLGAGTHQIHARFVGPPGRNLRNAVAVAVFLASVGLLLALRRRDRSSAA